MTTTKSAKWRNSGSAGATLVEFAFAFTVFLFFLGAAIDFGLVLQKWNQFSEVIASVARRAAVAEQSAGGCVAYATSAFQAGGDALQALKPNPSELINVTVDIPPPLAGTNAKILRIVGTWQVSCFFCQAMPGGITLHANTYTVSEGSC